MTIITILSFLNLLFAGMLAGIEFVIHYVVRTSAEKLDDHAQLQLRQALVLKLRVLVPAFFAPVLFLGAILTFLGSGKPGFVFQCVALVGLLIWLVIRVIGTVPINSATLDWQLNAPPKNWKEQVSRAERFHIVGVWATVVTFACFLTAVALTLTV